MLPKPWADMTLEERKAETAAQDATAAENYAKALAQSKDEYLAEHPEARLNGPAESHEDLHKQIADLKAQLAEYKKLAGPNTVTVPTTIVIGPGLLGAVGGMMLSGPKDATPIFTEPSPGAFMEVVPR